MRKPLNYWSKEKCREEALKYKCKKDFKLNSETAYNLTIKKSWMSEFSQHMTGRTLNWNVNMCKIDALKYKHKRDFIKYSSKAYHASIRIGCLDEVTAHMVRPENCNKFWDKEKCREEALKYSSRVDFQKKSMSAYQAASTNKWMDDIAKHMVRPENYNKIWNIETCTTEALKYETRTEFCDKSKGAYIVAHRLKIIDNICSHMKTCGSLMYRCVYVYEFMDNHAYVGLTHNFDIRNKQHHRSIKSSVNKHIIKTGLLPKHKILSEYVDVYLAQKLEKEYYLDYVKNGWDMLNIASTGGVGWIKLPKNR